MRYFYGENANRPLKVGAKQYTFEIVGQSAGTAQGVLSIEDSSEADVFLASTAKLGIVELTETEYKAYLAKKKRTLNSTGPSPQTLIQPARPVGAAIKGAHGVATPGAPHANRLMGAMAELPTTAADAVTIERISADAPTGDSVRPTPAAKPATKAQLKEAAKKQAAAKAIEAALPSDSAAETALGGEASAPAAADDEPNI